MKKLLSLLIMILLMPTLAYASGSISVSKNSMTLTKGQTGSFVVTASNAAGKVTISTSNGGVTTSTTSEWVENQAITVNVNAISVGSTVITISLSDAATFDEEELTGAYTINVNVVDSSGTNTNTNTKVDNTPVIDSDASLSSITLSNGTIEFNKDVLDYNVEVDNTVDKIDITSITNNKNAKVVVDGPETLAVGENKYTITVTATDGTSTKTYTITVVRKEASNNNYLKTLSVNNYNLKFDKNIVNYNLTISNEDYLTLTIEVEEEGATYEIKGNENLKNGSKIEVVVTALNGDKKTYTINILKNECKQNNTGLYICIGIIIILLGVIAYFVYITYFKNKKVKQSPINTNENQFNNMYQTSSMNNNLYNYDQNNIKETRY